MSHYVGIEWISEIDIISIDTSRLSAPVNLPRLHRGNHFSDQIYRDPLVKTPVEKFPQGTSPVEMFPPGKYPVGKFPPWKYQVGKRTNGSKITARAVVEYREKR